MAAGRHGQADALADHRSCGAGAAGTLCFGVSCPDGEPLTEFTDTEAPAARTSRLFLDFQVGGQVRTAGVTLEASAPDRAGQDARSADREPTRCGR